MKTNTVGGMRAQAAYCKADTPIVLVSDDPMVRAFLRTLEVEETYPDTTDAEGGWTSTFKVKVKAKV